MAGSYIPTGSSTTRGGVINPSLPEQPRKSSGGSDASSYIGEDDIHPYANPDNAIPYSREQVSTSPLRTASTLAIHIPSSESMATVKDSLTMSSSTKNKTPSTWTLDTGASFSPQGGHRTPSRTPSRMPSRISMFQGKEISSPIAVVNPTFRDNDTNSSTKDRCRDPIAGLPGLGDPPSSPAFSLISLEEARAQRLRSATVQSAMSSRAEITPVSFPEPGKDTAGTPGSDHSHPSISSTRPRGRSISAGAKGTKSALQHIVGGHSPPQPERRDSEPSATQQPQMHDGGVPIRQLKHKKSGFMRLFNGKEQKDREKERDRSPPPPVPALSETYTASRLPKATSQRVPVPTLPPMPLDPSPELHSNSGRHSSGLDSSILTTSNISSVSKRALPPLTINNSSRVSPAPALELSASSSQLNRTTPTSRLGAQTTGSHALGPQSAPAHTGDFPTLSLRPVSALFSAHFAEHIVRTGSPSSPEGDGDGSNSISTGFSPGPLTPGSSLRSIHEKPDISINSEDQSVTIRALQDQMVSSKKAWQQQIWELEEQVRDLKAEVEDLQAENGKSYCDVCGRGARGRTVSGSNHQQRDGSNERKKVGMINRPRPSTGAIGTSRFGN
jgi:hypothetical protein